MNTVKRAFIFLFCVWAGLIVYMISKGYAYTDPSIPPFSMSFHYKFLGLALTLCIISTGITFYYLKNELATLKQIKEKLVIGCTIITSLFLPALVFMNSGRAFSQGISTDLLLYGAVGLPGLLFGIIGYVLVNRTQTKKGNEKNIFEVMGWHFCRTVFLLFCLFVFLSWKTLGKLDLATNLVFALIISAGIGFPLFLGLEIMFPEINKETPAERKRVFREHQMAAKLTVVLTICLALFLMLLRLMFPIPPFGLTFLGALCGSLGVGLVFSTICTLVIWFIIGLEKPPFQNWND